MLATRACGVASIRPPIKTFVTRGRTRSPSRPSNTADGGRVHSAICATADLELHTVGIAKEQ
jgi:hypothetical protein